MYRSENAAPEDWVMVGTHDTPPLWRVAARWRETGADRAQADYLAWRLHPEPEGREGFARRLVEEPGLLVQAKFADLFASRARNVMIFFSDLLGLLGHLQRARHRQRGELDPARPGGLRARVPREAGA